MEIEQRRERFVELAVRHYKGSDGSKWLAALFCAQVVGNYSRGATMGLATDMNVSVDTIEDMASAYDLYSDLKGLAPELVRLSRKTNGIYLSHFRALADIRRRYRMNDTDILQILIDIVQSVRDGQPISSRDVADYAQERYGVTRSWTYYASKAAAALHNAMQCEDMSAKQRQEVMAWYEKLDAWAVTQKK